MSSPTTNRKRADGGGAAGPTQGTRLLPNMDRPPDRYLTGNCRDFIALFAR